MGTEDNTGINLTLGCFCVARTAGKLVGKLASFGVYCNLSSLVCNFCLAQTRKNVWELDRQIMIRAPRRLLCITPSTVCSESD